MQQWLLALIVIASSVTMVCAISEQEKQQINMFISDYMRDKRLVGLGLALVENGTITWTRGFGFQDRETGILIDPQLTMFRWASMSKMITGIIAAKLASANQLDLDANIERYLVPTGYKTPDTFVIRCNGKPSIRWNGTEYICHNGWANISIPEDHHIITSRMLLAHHAAIMSYDNGIGDPQPPIHMRNDPKYNTGIEWALSFFARKPLVSLPPLFFNYTTFGFNLQGVVSEHAAQQSYIKLAEQFVLRRAGTLTMQPDYEWLSIPNRAVGYRGGKSTGKSSDVSYKLPGGGFISTVEDAARFCAHLRNESILTKSEKQLLWSPWYSNTPGYGQGFALERSVPSGEVSVVGHNGNQEKTSTALRYYLHKDTCIVIMSNSEDMKQDEVVSALQRILRLL